MAKIIYSERFTLDLQRVADFLLEANPANVSESIELILDGISILARHPWIGRPAEDNLRELLIAQGRNGYVALYDYIPEASQIHILALRHQREVGYTDDAPENH